MTWLILEAMALPYTIRTVPLRRYMLDGEQKDPEYIAMVGPDGVVPGVQFSSRRGFDPAVQSVERIFEELQRRYPSRFPSGDDPLVRAQACEGEGSVFARLRVARRTYEACAGANSSNLAALEEPLSSALVDLDAMLAVAAEARTADTSDGDDGVWWLDGSSPSPTIADLTLLPFLERTAAVVPYFFGEDALARAGVPFKRADEYVRRARVSHAAYNALCSDATTLARTNLRYAEVGATPRYSVPSLVVDAAAAGRIDGTEEATCDAWAISAMPESRRDAAARLAARPESVAAFARRCAELPPHDDDSEDAVMDDALQAVASLLLLSPAPSTDASQLRHAARRAADELQRAHGCHAAADAAAALAALSVNVGVPRDMGIGAARALRSHARIVADALDASRARAAVATLRGGFAATGAASVTPTGRWRPRGSKPRNVPRPLCQLSSGLTFSDGDGQRLVSIQKPLGLLLEEAEEGPGVFVAEVAARSNAERAGVCAGDVLLAVNNLDVRSATMDGVMVAIADVPGRVVNLRFQRDHSE